MKKYACLLLFALLLNGCDDGDITVETLDFKDIKSASCDPTTNKLLYKIKNQESLLLQLDINTLQNEPTLPGSPRTHNIDNSTYKFFYRSYNGPVAISNICDLIPPTTPNVVNQWFAKSGIIEITTTAQVSPPNATTGATTITGYTHSIIVKNITYNVSSLDITQPEVVFGDYAVTVAAPDLNFSKEIKQCLDSKQIYTYNSNSAMTIDAIESNLIKNEITPLNNPRTGLIGTDKNKLLYRVFTGSALTDAYFCQTTIPTTPILKETWAGVTGVPDKSGIIEVTTTTFGENKFKHTIRLRNTTVKKLNNEFNLGTSYLIGEMYTDK